MNNNQNFFPVKWYQTGLGVLLAGLLFTVVVGILIFGFFAGSYYWQIKHGKGADLQAQFYGPEQESDTIKQARAELEDVSAPYLGNKGAPIVIVEFIDFKCPNCSATLSTLKQLLTKYGGKIKLIVRDFPIESAHPGANQLAVLARCAFAQGLYWPTHDWLFVNQSNLAESLSADEIKGVAANLSLDLNKLQNCLTGTAAKIQVNKDYAAGFKYEITGTPTFFVNGHKIEGTISFDTWEKIIAQY